MDGDTTTTITTTTTTETTSKHTSKKDKMKRKSQEKEEAVVEDDEEIEVEVEEAGEEHPEEASSKDKKKKKLSSFSPSLHIHKKKKKSHKKSSKEKEAEEEEGEEKEEEEERKEVEEEVKEEKEEEEKEEEEKEVKKGSKKGSKKGKKEAKKEAKKEEQLIESVNWFEFIAGMNEREFRMAFKNGSILDKVEVTPATRKDVPEGSHTVKINGHNAGTLFVCSINELREMAKKNKGTKDVSPILLFETQDPSADKENEGATFQVASNFNGIEAIEDRSTPDEIDFVTNYIYDMTQGPAASVSAGPAAISRVFTPFYSEKASKKPESWRQTKKQQIELLKGVSKYYGIRNGYVVNTKKQAALPSDPAALAKLEGEVKVCVHVGVDVPFARTDFMDLMSVMEKPNTINQVFCAAMNLSQGFTGQANSQLKDSDEKSKFILRAAYRGTYLAALNCGSKKLFLTLIGGGAFGNPQINILRTIVEVHKELALSKEINGSLEEVHVSLFSKPACLPTIIEEVKEEKIPFKYIVYGRTKVVADQYLAPKKKIK